MKGFFERIAAKMREIMAGRYGTDDFSRFLLVVTMVLLLISMFAGQGILYFVALACLIYSYFRILSKNYVKRRAENEKYLSMTAKIRKSFRITRKRFSDRKDYRYFKCPNCSQEVRVPKGKGRIRITCPKCRTQFDRTV